MLTKKLRNKKVNENKREREGGGKKGNKNKEYAVPSSEIAYALFARELKKRKRTNNRAQFYEIGGKKRRVSFTLCLAKCLDT